jgi:glycosyltransferase involved in cell wall biosynthesis
MNILFISPNGFEANHSLQIHNLANALVNFGFKCAILVPGNSFECYKIHNGEVFYEPYSYDEFNFFSNSFNPEIIHAWTPREPVRIQSKKILNKYPNSRLIIHLEDNEQYLVESFHKYPYQLLKFFHPIVHERVLLRHLSHPIFSNKFLHESSGITGIISTLKEFCPNNKPFFELWPIFEIPEINKESEIFKILNIDTETIKIGYTGHVHDANLNEVIELYEAVFNLYQEGLKIVLIRTGLENPKIRDLFNFRYEKIEKYLGFIPRSEIVEIQRNSDLLIQPGKNDKFNFYRFPSKIPEFLLSGRPTALPESNIANHLTPGYNAILLNKGNRFEIENLILDYLKRPDYYLQIGAEGRKFAQQYFSSNHILKGIVGFYNKVLSQKISS